VDVFSVWHSQSHGVRLWSMQHGHGPLVLLTYHWWCRETRPFVPLLRRFAEGLAAFEELPGLVGLLPAFELLGERRMADCAALLTPTHDPWRR
jgi:hypothetical protein